MKIPPRITIRAMGDVVIFCRPNIMKARKPKTHNVTTSAQLNAVLTKQLAPGDTVNIAPGIYRLEAAPTSSK